MYILSLIILIECIYFCVRKVRYSEVHHPESCFCPPSTSSLAPHQFACSWWGLHVWAGKRTGHRTERRMAIAITNEEAAAPTTNDADLGEQQPTAVNSVVSAMGHHRVFAVNSRTWQPSMPVPLKLIHDHEKDIEQSCLDGDYARFMELANVKWGYRLRGTNDTQTQQLLFRDDEAPDFQYSLDLVTPPDCKRFLHSHNGSITEFDEKSFLHLAVQGENVEIVAHLADLCGGVTGAMNRQDTLGRTPFQLACKYGKLDFVNVLWNRRRTGDRLLLNTTDTDGQSPFHISCCLSVGLCSSGHLVV